jgi:hypothetical protein
LKRSDEKYKVHDQDFKTVVGSFSRNERNFIGATMSFNRVIAIDGVPVSGVIFTSEGVG